MNYHDKSRQELLRELRSKIIEASRFSRVGLATFTHGGKTASAIADCTGWRVRGSDKYRIEWRKMTNDLLVKCAAIEWVPEDPYSAIELLAQCE